MLDLCEPVTPGHVQPPTVIARSLNDNMDRVNRTCGRCSSMLQIETKFRSTHASRSASQPEKSTELLIIDKTELAMRRARVYDLAERPIRHTRGRWK